MWARFDPQKFVYHDELKRDYVARNELQALMREIFEVEIRAEVDRQIRREWKTLTAVFESVADRGVKKAIERFFKEGGANDAG